MDKKQHYPFDPADNGLIARFTTFMVNVVTSAKIDYLRKQRHWDREVPTDTLPVSNDISPDAGRWQNVVPEGGFDFAEERISDAFSALTQTRRRILELSFIAGMPAAEIAEQLGCSVKFVYDQKHAALKKLRDLLLRGGEQDV